MTKLMNGSIQTGVLLWFCIVVVGLTLHYNVTQGIDTNESDIGQTVIMKNESAEEIDLSNSTEEESFPNKSCSLIPDHLVGRLKVLLEDKSWEDISKDLEQIEEGGEYSPATCYPKDRVAVIIPFRNRDSQLRIFLNHIHPILMRQNIHYRIFVLSQEGNETFNRAMLFNVGFAEASKISAWDCYIFHDVDLLPEDDRNLYTCPDSPRHMSVAVDKFNYNLPYEDLFGGVSAISTEHFKLINGFSNQFWGWGGEDDDMSRRVRDNKLIISRYKPGIARYTMIKHTNEVDNKPNPKRFEMLENSPRFHKTDGLNNLKYNLLNITTYPVYTMISVELSPVEYALEPKKKHGKKRNK